MNTKMNMDLLVKGIHQFNTTIARPHKDFFKRISEAQAPFALFITCSDSRIDPNLITQSDPGTLFSIRNPGNIIPKYTDGTTSEAAAIEFAIEGLGIEKVIICGHINCGAIDALLHKDVRDKYPCMGRWVAHAEPVREIVEKHYSHLENDDLLIAASEENVLEQVDNLKTYPCIEKAIAAGKMEIYAWVYHLVTAEVYSFDSEKEAFVSLLKTTNHPVFPNGPVYKK
ncbi:MAG: carbonic anhydrase [Chlamydiales bacterium]|jgi:carbonic anhydrase